MYAVFGDDDGLFEWSEVFDDLTSAIKCYKEWVEDRGTPESISKDYWSCYFLFGAHGESVSIVTKPYELEKKLASSSNVWSQQHIIWDHVVRIKQQSKRSRRRLMLRKRAQAAKLDL